MSQLLAVLRQERLDWGNIQATDLLFRHRDDAILAVVVLIGVLAVMVARSLMRARAGRTQAALPAVLDWHGRSWVSSVRHAPLLIFLAGVPFFTLALGDPYSNLVREDVSFPGRRIAVMIDASSSMMVRFPAEKLNANTPRDATFFTAVSAAELFIRQRIDGKYRDLIGLVEFGDEAYVVTPFTSDYDNILLSLSLIGDWNEFLRFPDEGTTIGKAIDAGTGLFRAFDFLDASGNLLLLFTDGQDTQVTVQGRPVSEILAAAVQTKIPVFMIRTSYDKALGEMLPDEIWKPAIESTGGKFYAAGSEAEILAAIKDIDRRSTGRIDMKRYSHQQPKFAGYAIVSAGLWTIALALQLTVPYFRKFP